MNNTVITFILLCILGSLLYIIIKNNDTQSKTSIQKSQDLGQMKYSCDYDRNGYKCIENQNGPYNTNQECINNCTPPKPEFIKVPVEVPVVYSAPPYWSGRRPRYWDGPRYWNGPRYHDDIADRVDESIRH